MTREWWPISGAINDKAAAWVYVHDSAVDAVGLGHSDLAKAALGNAPGVYPLGGLPLSLAKIEVEVK